MQLTEVPKRRQFGYWAGSPVANNYKLDVANPLSEGPGLSPQDSCTIMRFMYERTGDPQYLTRGAILLLGSADGESDQLGAPQCQAFVFRDLHQQDAAVGWRPIDDVQVTALGAGSYRLSWTVPAGADAYQVKYADKPIVEWLGHDQLTRRFQFDPDDFVAFFAASNIDSEPAPRPAGQRQDLVVSGLAPNQLWHFAIRYHRAP
jgi:hypothetical protein